MSAWAVVSDAIARRWFLPLAMLLALAVGVIFWRTGTRRRVRLARLGDLDVLERMLPAGTLRADGRWRGILLGVAALCLGVALAGPRWGQRSIERRDTGIDVAFVLDVSASMLAADDGPSRLQQMKSDVRRLLVLLPGARVALIVVAGRSYLLTPLTPDHDALELFLDGLDPSMVSQGGTALVEGVTQATQLLGASESGGDRAVVVMSDGETWDAEGEIASAARAARDARLAVVTVAYGSAAGATIPLPGGGVKRDADDKIVITKSSAATLEGIARLGDGVFVDALTPDRPGRVRAALRRLRQTERVFNGGAVPIQRYAWFVWPAFLLLAVDAVIGARRRVPRAAAMLLACGGSLLCAGVAQSQVTDRAAPGRVVDATALFRERRFPEAVRAFRGQMRDGDRSLRTQYNLGTALLEADSIAAATEMLDKVVAIAPDQELRFRALFNLGLANLRRGRKAPQATAGPYLDAAVALYKRALRTRDDDQDARWNLELALREQQRQSGGGGAGGGGQQPPPQPAPQKSKAQEQLDRQRAEAVLNSAARDERETQTRRQRDGRRQEATAGRDW